MNLPLTHISSLNMFSLRYNLELHTSKPVLSFYSFQDYVLVFQETHPWKERQEDRHDSNV